MATCGRFRSLIAGCLLIAACEPSGPTEVHIQIPEDDSDLSISADTAFDLVPVSFFDLDDWRSLSLEASVSAFERTCLRLQTRNSEELLSNRANYGGTIGDWLPACDILHRYIEVGELHRFFEDYFQLFRIETDEATNRLTGYYEPELRVSPTPTSELSEPIPARPDDLIEINLGDFEENLSGRRIWGRVEDNRFVRYHARADIQTESDRALAYAHPNDVFFLQIQGSGRLRFPDGQLMRAGFSAHNHRPFGSLANHLIRTGEITRGEASMTGIRAWMERVGRERAQQAMNVNPRFVWFGLSSINDPSEGPVGAAGLPLTGMGSMAVDLEHHPLGVPFFIRSRIPDAPGEAGETQSLLLISQDTGGAIQGIRRGDIFFGSGDEAGGLAGSMNQPGEFYVLLPQPISTTDISG